MLELLTTLYASKSSGPDGISARMLKSTAGNICPLVTLLFNHSIASGQIPDQWKQSHVVPIPKSTKVQSPDNYWPTSLLSVLSKFLENHVHSLITSHLLERCILSDSQWGFLPGRSTVSALLSTVCHWFQLFEEGKEVFAVFQDFRKAFDSVPHGLLIQKLYHIGLDGHLILRVSNYLTTRMWQVVADGAPLPV